MTEETLKWLTQLQRMENPMQNLIDAMKNAVSGIAQSEKPTNFQKYSEVYDRLEESSKAIRDAVKAANNAAYGIKKK